MFDWNWRHGARKAGLDEKLTSSNFLEWMVLDLVGPGAGKGAERHKAHEKRKAQTQCRFKWRNGMKRTTESLIINTLASCLYAQSIRCVFFHLKLFPSVCCIKYGCSLLMFISFYTLFSAFGLSLSHREILLKKKEIVCGARDDSKVVRSDFSSYVDVLVPWSFQHAVGGRSRRLLFLLLLKAVNRMK